MAHRGYGFLLCILPVLLFAWPAAYADDRPVSAITDARAEITESHAVLLSWTEQSEGAFLYTVTLCNEETRCCQLGGTTIAQSLILDNLEADTAYTAHIGAAGGSALELTIVTPEEAVITGDTLPAAEILGDTSALVTWPADAQDPPVYFVSLARAGDSQFVRQGTTTGHSFVIGGLTPGADYCVHIGTAAEALVSCCFSILPAADPAP